MSRSKPSIRRNAGGRISSVNGRAVRYDAGGRPHIAGGGSELLKAIAFQIGKDEAVSRAEAVELAEFFVRYGPEE